ncbi:hypothetical protein THAOC_32608 [Thalassiosira oceanica]|uniref:Uncharacterized protein n=1 Tax=Thalassiosira oceanica TaxID=159749 RepID=K0R6T4_THAOC|nr:hypothetical protein THAOC_32608 [Thalassiosira oceanica]|eukprot:EJK48580.1 hypothetical protein THAOC_32608 [Thalassiosira oceanica]
MSSNQQVLHPAAAVFRDQVMAGIGEENARLAAQVSRLMPLYEALNSVKVYATTNQEPVSISIEEGVNGMGIMKSNGINEVIAETTLLDGHVAKLEQNEDDECEEELQFSINSSHPPLRLQNLGGGCGGIGLSVSGNSLGFFPNSPFGRGKTELWVEDESICFMFKVDKGVVIGGTLTGLDEGCKLKFMSGERHGDYFTDFLAFPAPLPFHQRVGQEELTDVKFDPTWVDLRYNSELEQLVGLLKKVADANASAASFSCAGTDLRFLVADALGEDVHKKLLQENDCLQRNLEALDCLRAYALRIEITHSAGTLICTMDDGHELPLAIGKEWAVSVPEHEGNVMVLKDFHRSCFLLGGESIKCQGMLGQQYLHTSGTGIVYLSIPLERGITLMAHVVEWPEEDLAHISDPHFRTRLGMAIGGGVGSYRANGTLLTELPPTIKIKVDRILFNFKHYKHLLTLCGKDELLEQDEDIIA